MPKAYPKLRGRITEKYGTIGNFAKALNTQQQQVSRKLSKGVAITRDDVIEWCGLLEISSEKLGIYFYPEVQENSNKE